MFLIFLCVWQVIVTTPMEMLKIQLQDAGRIGEKKKRTLIDLSCKLKIDSRGENYVYTRIRGHSGHMLAETRQLKIRKTWPGLWSSAFVACSPRDLCSEMVIWVELLSCCLMQTKALLLAWFYTSCCCHMIGSGFLFTVCYIIRKDLVIYNHTESSEFRRKEKRKHHWRSAQDVILSLFISDYYPYLKFYWCYLCSW